MVYATMIFIVQMSLLLFYRFYCSRKFAEAKYQISLDKRILKPILSFSSWSMVAGISSTLSSQGILILLNMFFLPAVVSARAISLQVNNAAYQLVTNFRTAVNPQIVKLYAINDYQGSKKLLLQSTKYSYYLMLFMSLPMYFLADPLLYIWLGDNVPEYTTIFLQIAIVQSLFQVFDVSFYTALYAKGQLKENALISPMLNLLAFPVVYLLFENGFSPVALSWAYLIVYVLAGLLIKPLLIVKIVDYKWNEILSVFIRCFWVTVSAAIPSFFMNKLLDSSTVKGFVSELLLLVVIVVISIYTVGLDEIMRKKIQNFIWSKVKLCNKKGKCNKIVSNLEHTIFKMVLCSILNTTIILPIFATVMIRRNGMEFLSLHRKQIKKGIESTRNLFDTVLFWGRYFVAVDIL